MLKEYLVPSVLKDKEYSKAKYRKTATSYMLWLGWLLAANVSAAYGLQSYTKEIHLIEVFLQAFHFISLFLFFIFLIISLYYFYESLFMVKDKTHPKLESLTFFDPLNIDMYATKLKWYLTINLGCIIFFLLNNFLSFFKDSTVELINILLVIVFFISLAPVRTYKEKLGGCLGDTPSLFFPKGGSLLYIQAIKYLLKYKK